MTQAVFDTLPGRLLTPALRLLAASWLLKDGPNTNITTLDPHPVYRFSDGSHHRLPTVWYHQSVRIHGNDARLTA